MRRWPGTACAVAVLDDGGAASGNEQLVAAYREAYGDQHMLVGKTRVKSTGRSGPLRAFGEDGFITAVVLDPVIVRMLRYESEESRMLDLQIPLISAEYERGLHNRTAPQCPNSSGSASL